jgi:hypothetical protein
MTTPARILFDVPRSHYDAITDRVNFSTLKLMAESPAHYKHAVDQKLTAEFDPGEDDEKSDTLLQGEATHVCVLEPELYGGFDAENTEFAPVDPNAPPAEPRGRFVVYRGGKRDDRVKRYQSVTASAKLHGQQILTPGQHAHAMRVAAAVRRSSLAAPYITGGRREVTVTWDHVDPGAPGMGFPGWSIQMKTRLDYLTSDFIVDLKGTRSARPEAFSKQAWNLGYFAQAALHIEAVKAATGRALQYRWVVVENKAPHVVMVFQPSAKGLLRAGQILGEWLARLHACIESNEWPPYGTGLMELDPPAWATPEDMDLMEAA